MSASFTGPVGGRVNNLGMRSVVLKIPSPGPDVFLSNTAHSAFLMMLRNPKDALPTVIHCHQHWSQTFFSRPEKRRWDDVREEGLSYVMAGEQCKEREDGLWRSVFSFKERVPTSNHFDGNWKHPVAVSTT